MIGFNFKFTDIQAVLGIVQMGKLDWRVNRMKEIYADIRKIFQILRNSVF